MIGAFLKVAGYYHRAFPNATFNYQMARNFHCAARSAGACADIYAIPMWSDNYCYVIVDRETKKAAVVDPGEPVAVFSGLESIDCQVDMLLCTHKHDDHAGGNDAFASKYPGLPIISTKHEPIPAVTKTVDEGDEFSLGSLHIRTLFVPCHTAGHVAFVISKPSDASLAPILCCGDTLFVGGCGRFFEGTADQMLANMDKFAQLTPETVVCCAHEYTESNFRFLNSVDESRVGQRYQEIQQIRQSGEPTVPSTIAEEMQYNLFMNCRDASVQRAVIGKEGSAVDTMARLREMKNNFR
jgi:hydroxyacylglutathione hydrolase